MSFVGIDLGTTYSAIARLGDDGNPVIIQNAEGEMTTPSAVYFESESDVVVGRHAKRALWSDPELVVQNVKRHMGDKHYGVAIHGKTLHPVDISALILKKLKQDAERVIGPITGAVITVPAYFDESRRYDTVAAGELAGLNVIDIVNEPTAAALAHAYREILGKNRSKSDAIKQLRDDKTICHLVVYDLGGGTFDVTVMRRQGGDLTVLATAGDVELGGYDWNSRIVDHIAELFLALHETDPRHEWAARVRLFERAEEIKRDLSSRKRAPFEIYHAGQELRGEITRDEFEHMTSDLLFRTESRLNRVLKEAGLDWSQVSTVLAVGGSTRMPKVVEMLQRVSGKSPDMSLSPDEAVAHGAAIHAAICSTQSLGSKPEEQTHSEAEHTSLLTRVGNHIVSLLKILKTTNVNAHSLGIVTTDGSGLKGVSTMIARNTPLPTDARRTFGTVISKQKRVTVEVVEGESRKVDDCILVGTCTITSLPEKLPKGSPIEVTFSYDASSRLHIEAVHVTSGTWAKTIIDRDMGVDPGKIHLTPEMIQRLTVT